MDIRTLLQGVLTFNPFLGLQGGPGIAEGLFEEKTPNTGLNLIFDELGLKGAMPEGMKPTIKDAAPWVGAGFASAFGLPPGVGQMAGNIAGLAALGGKDDRYRVPNYQSRWNNQGLLQWILGVRY